MVRPVSRPRISEPEMLITRVPRGNAAPARARIRPSTTKRATAPRPPASDEQQDDGGTHAAARGPRRAPIQIPSAQTPKPTTTVVEPVRDGGGRLSGAQQQVDVDGQRTVGGEGAAEAGADDESDAGAALPPR